MLLNRDWGALAKRKVFCFVFFFGWASPFLFCFVFFFFWLGLPRKKQNTFFYFAEGGNSDAQVKRAGGREKRKKNDTKRSFAPSS
jgi:hypothetical protein